MRDFRGKKALITGAASGIGRALALRLAREGVDLFLLDIDDVRLAETAAEARALRVEVINRRCDLSRPADVSLAVRHLLTVWGTLDILVNNAGICYYGPTAKMTTAQWDRLMAVNLLAPMQLVRELLPTLLDKPEAHIVNIASIYGMVTTRRCTIYHASKFGLVGFSEALRAEYGRQGLGVTTVCPGFVRTNFFSSMDSGQKGRNVPTPPDWISTTAEHVAEKVVRGIRRNRALVLVTWAAYVLYYAKRAAPWLLDWLQQLGRRKKMRRKAWKLAQKKSAA